MSAWTVGTCDGCFLLTEKTTKTIWNKCTLSMSPQPIHLTVSNTHKCKVKIPLVQLEMKKKK